MKNIRTPFLATLLTSALLTTQLFAAIDTSAHNAKATVADNTQQNPLKGVWQTAKKDDENRTAHVEIYDCGEQLCGKIIALEEPIDPETGEPKLDKKNPDESLRDRPIMGVKMLKGFTKKDDVTYVDGTIYSPRTGKTYESKLHLNKEGVLEITGYIFFFSKTQDWTRVK